MEDAVSDNLHLLFYQLYCWSCWVCTFCSNILLCCLQRFFCILGAKVFAAVNSLSDILAQKHDHMCEEHLWFTGNMKNADNVVVVCRCNMGWHASKIIDRTGRNAKISRAVAFWVCLVTIGIKISSSLQIKINIYDTEFFLCLMNWFCTSKLLSQEQNQQI